eukprot:365077-Chlamydomonas_euryale.AAC.15
MQTLLQEIRKSLNIPNEHHTQWLRELVAAKKSGKLNTRAEFPGKQQPQQVPQQVPPAFLPPQKPQKHEKPKPSTASRPGRVNPAEAAKKAKAQAAAQADAEQQANKKQQPPEGLPSNPVHMKGHVCGTSQTWSTTPYLLILGSAAATASPQARTADLALAQQRPGLPDLGVVVSTQQFLAGCHKLQNTIIMLSADAHMLMLCPCPLLVAAPQLSSSSQGGIGLPAGAARLPGHSFVLSTDASHALCAAGRVQLQQQELSVVGEFCARSDSVAELLHTKICVQFYNKDSGWHEGVVMAYDATEGKVEVALLNSKKREKLDYKKSHCLLVHENELVTDLSNYV